MGVTPTAVEHDGDAKTVGRTRVWVNWILALLTVPGAAAVMVLALGAVMSTAGCTGGACPDPRLSGVTYDLMFYGAPVVAAVTIIASFFTATRPRGIWVPLVAWALLIADIALMAFTF
jgi:hypothetical protein